MAYAAELSVRRKHFPDQDRDRLVGLLDRLGLPTQWSGAGMDLPWSDLRAAISADKKTLQSVPRLVLAERLGSVVFGCEVPDEVLEETFTRS